MKIGKAFCIRALEDDNDEKLCWGSVLEIRIVPHHNHNHQKKICFFHLLRLPCVLNGKKLFYDYDYET